MPSRPARCRAAASPRRRRSRIKSRCAASARPPRSRRWRWRCSRSASARTSPAPPSWWTAASRCTTGSIHERSKKPGVADHAHRDRAAVPRLQPVLPAVRAAEGHHRHLVAADPHRAGRGRAGAAVQEIVDFALTEEQLRIREAIGKLCARFPDGYWLERDRASEKGEKAGGFPADFHHALARDGWLGVAMPEEFGGAGLGIAEAAVMMQAIAESGAGFSGASAVHMNIFGLNPVVVFGTPEQKGRMLPPLIRGEERACFAVTEPNTGLNTKKILTKAEKRGDGYVVSGQKVWISTAQVAEKVLLLAQAPAGLTLFYTDLDRGYVEVREIDKMGRHAV